MICICSDLHFTYIYIYIYLKQNCDVSEFEIKLLQYKYCGNMVSFGNSYVKLYFLFLCIHKFDKLLTCSACTPFQYAVIGSSPSTLPRIVWKMHSWMEIYLEYAIKMQSEQNIQESKTFVLEFIFARHSWNTTSSGEYIKHVYTSCYKQVNVDNRGNPCGDIWMKWSFEREVGQLEKCIFNLEKIRMRWLDTRGQCQTTEITHTHILKLSPASRLDLGVHEYTAMIWDYFFYQRFVLKAESIGPYLSLFMKHIFK